MKILALHLPQFHRIKENDIWWGEGFTEWYNVKRAKPLYKNHQQPKLPIDDYYYDLSKVEDIKRQVKLAREYRVDGFIYYHYWFTGKKLLEKPCELLLDNKDIDIEYSFCWANEPWTRAWDGKDTDILMPQEYGNEEDWKNHIDYLIPFFKDERYIKKDGKPMLYIYAPNRIPRFDEMIKYWNNVLKEENLKEIYLVEFISTKNQNADSKYSRAVMEFEPLYTTFFDISIFNKLKRFLCKKMKIIDFQNYDNLWKKIIKRKRTYTGKTIYKGCFCGWDNSARKGRNSMIVKKNSSEKFERYFRKLISSNRKDTSNDFIIVNAWNEWSEGAMLEPSKSDGLRYLQSIKRVVEENEK